MSNMDPLTIDVYEFVRDYRRERGISPSYREIADGCHMARSSVQTHLARLEGKGWLTREMNIARSLQLGERAPDYDDDILT